MLTCLTKTVTLRLSLAVTGTHIYENKICYYPPLFTQLVDYKHIAVLTLLAASLVAAGETTLAGGSVASNTPVTTTASVPLTTASGNEGSGFSLEVAGNHRWAARGLLKSGAASASLDGTLKSRGNVSCNGAVPQEKLDTAGVDLTLVKKLSEHHSVNLRFGYSTGDLDVTLSQQDIAGMNFSGSGLIGTLAQKLLPQMLAGFKGHARLHNFSLMPGYRYTCQVTPQVAFYAGANVVINSSLKGDVSISKTFEGHNMQYNANGHDSQFGFAYSAEVGARYAVTKRLELFAAYEFFGSTTHPELKTNQGTSISGIPIEGSIGLTTRKQIYHGVRAGLSYAF